MDTTNIFYPTSLRPAVRQDLSSGLQPNFASGVTSIELRDGQELLEVKNLETPILFANRVILPPEVDLNETCGVEQDACNARIQVCSSAPESWGGKDVEDGSKWLQPTETLTTQIA